MFKKFLINVIEKKANKLIAGALGSVATWVAAFGFPLDQFVSDATIVGIGSTVTSMLVYAVRNYT